MPLVRVSLRKGKPAAYRKAILDGIYVRSRELGKTILTEPKKDFDGRDWDQRVKDRISKLKPDEIGYQKVTAIKVNGVVQTTKEHETILEVNLNKPIFPGSNTEMELSFEAQVPLQIRPSGQIGSAHV